MKKLLLTISISLVSICPFFLTGCEKEDPNAISMSDVNKGVIMIQGKDGHEYAVVDLGLTTGKLWATCNVGADSPEQFGTFFAWGETEPKEIYSWDSYKWVNNGDPFEFNKYCVLKAYGGVEQFKDDKKTLEKADDAATVLLGDNFSTPTPKDFTELDYRCKKRRCKLNGVWGFLFTSTVKGYENNSIFIPLSGRMDSSKGESQHKFKGDYGFYWCNTVNDTPTSFVFWMETTNGENSASSKTSLERYIGLNIRAVTKAK